MAPREAKAGSIRWAGRESSPRTEGRLEGREAAVRGVGEQFC